MREVAGALPHSVGLLQLMMGNARVCMVSIEDVALAFGFTGRDEDPAGTTDTVAARSTRSSAVGCRQEDRSPFILPDVWSQTV